MTRLFGWRSKARNRMRLPVGGGKKSARDGAEDKKLRKDLYCLGGPCFEGTLRKALSLRTSFPNEVPWPGQLRISFRKLSENLDAGDARELQQIPAQPHICSR
jgi:hypothetical protein